MRGFGVDPGWDRPGWGQTLFVGIWGQAREGTDPACGVVGIGLGGGQALHAGGVCMQGCEGGGYGRRERLSAREASEGMESDMRPPLNRWYAAISKYPVPVRPKTMRFGEDEEEAISMAVRMA